ncbi:MAG TPA: hypothetical protein VKW77_10400, partial [Acidimicrobiales bacterium]|nr:hypothetical protein [Acidimicrobiales bacterium]
PNVRGASMAVDAGIDHLTVTVSVSEEYSRRNVGMSSADSLAAAEQIAGMAPVVDVVLSCAFGSPYEGAISPTLVGGFASRCRSAGATVTLADTTGMATPRTVTDVLSVTGVDVGLHLHDTRGTALVNAFAAWEAGVGRFDTAIGGLGGSPFATGAGGNLATEDLVYLFDDLGIDTGVDFGRLLAASALASSLVGRPVPSRVAAASAAAGPTTPPAPPTTSPSPGGALGAVV